MKRTLVLNVSHRGVALETQQCLARCTSAGARMISLVGVADVALARNQGMTKLLELTSDDPAEVVVLVDDDMVFKPEAVLELVTRARETGQPWSAIYATKDNKVAATRFDWNANEKVLWMVGLGLCALPSRMLRELELELGRVVGPNGEQIVPFCQSSVVMPADAVPRWCSEDYWFSRAVGGFRLAPVGAGHLKTVDLWPDQATLERFSNPLWPSQAELDRFTKAQA